MFCLLSLNNNAAVVQTPAHHNETLWCTFVGVRSSVGSTQRRVRFVRERLLSRRPRPVLVAVVTAQQGSKAGDTQPTDSRPLRSKISA
jgi:hypothetical protein